MKGLKRWGMALAVLVAMTGISRAAVTEEPVTLPDSLLTVTVSDVHGFIDGLGGVAAQVNPMMNGMMIKGQLGMMLGDPGLTGIAPGKGLAVVVLNETNMVGFVEVSEAQSAAYVAKFLENGMKAQYTDGLLIAGQSDALIARGVALVPAVRTTLLAKRSPALRVGLQPAKLVAQKNDDIEGMLGMMPMMIGMAKTPGLDADGVEGLSRVFEGEVRFLLSLSSQCEAAEVILAPVNGAIRLDQVFKAKPGSRLAALLAAPKVNTSNPAVQSGVLGEAAIALDATLSNSDALTSYFVEEMAAVTQAMGVSGDEMTGWLSVMKKWMGIYGESFCENISFGGDSFVNASYLLEVKDEAEALKELKTMSTDMAPILSLYKGLGMPLSMNFKEAVREYKGIKIHQIEMKFLTDQMPDASSAQLQALGLDQMLYEVAVFDGKMLCAMGGRKIETLIDRIKDSAFVPAPLKARSVYPAGGFYYCDADMAKYLSGIAAVMPAEPNNPLPQLAAMMQGAEPVTSAGFREGHLVMWSANIPGSLVAKVGQAAMMMQMQ